MLVGMGPFPYAGEEDPDLINRLGSWSERMTQSNHKSSPDITPTQGDLKTANFFGKRIVEITKKFKG
ncbi:transcriptional regulator [Rickettsia sp. 2024-CO-Wats]|uniref:transcriptional regulator n=1 Tax=Rickettsia sp. 2024-CO-Wats TaxID=3348345 RepID=UPI003CC810C7